MFRTVPDFVIQFGIHGDPEVSEGERTCYFLRSCGSVDNSLEWRETAPHPATLCLWVFYRSRRTGGSNASTTTPSLNRTSVDASRLLLLVYYC